MSLGLVDKDLVKKVQSGELRRLRQSLLNDADICLRRAGYGLSERRVYSASEPTLAGTAFHAALETYYRWRKRVEETEAKGFFGEWPAPPTNLTEAMYLEVAASVFDGVRELEDFEFETSLQETIERAQQMVYQYFAQGAYWPAQYRILGVEVDFTIESEFEGWADSGTMDLVVFNTETRHTILDDHKTAKRKWKAGKGTPRHTNQPAVYTSAWERATGVRPDAFSFSIMTYKGEFERRMVFVTPEDEALSKNKARIVLPLLVDSVERGLELPGNTESFLCSPKWCSYWDICCFGGAIEPVMPLMSTQETA